jgi:hypothetical protein
LEQHGTGVVANAVADSLKSKSWEILDIMELILLEYCASNASKGFLVTALMCAAIFKLLLCHLQPESAGRAWKDGASDIPTSAYIYIFQSCFLNCELMTRPFQRWAPFIQPSPKQLSAFLGVT